jgi:hypothetical protein
MKWKIYILVSPAMQESPLYQSWILHADYPCVFITDNPGDWSVPDDAGVVVSHMHFRWEYAQKLWQIYCENQVPVLILADGILEFRNIWQNPEIKPTTFYQPVLGHKIACIGPSQAQFINNWGNRGKCEVVGLPRLDQFRQIDHQENDDLPYYTLLFVSSSTPFFTKAQGKFIFKAYRHLHEFSLANPILNDKPVRYRWRVHPKIQRFLSLTSEQIAGGNLLDELLLADGVVTSPSTVFIESTLLHIPTAMLDYHNAPKYIQSAWYISTREQIEDVINELLQLPQGKLPFQNETLAMNYNMENMATDSLVQLIKTLIECRDTAYLKNQSLTIPTQILPHPFFTEGPKQRSEVNEDLNQEEMQIALESLLMMAHQRMGQFPEEIHKLRMANFRLKKALQEQLKKNDDIAGAK